MSSNLKSFNHISKERGDEIRAMGQIALKTPEARAKHSLAMKKHHFRRNNPDINALMEYYKNGDELAAMEKYMTDIYKMNELLQDAETLPDRLNIMKTHMGFQLEIHKLCFGTKNTNKNFNKDSPKQIDVVMHDSTGEVKCPKCGEIFKSEDNEIFETRISGTCKDGKH